MYLSNDGKSWADMERLKLGDSHEAFIKPKSSVRLHLVMCFNKLWYRPELRLAGLDSCAWRMASSSSRRTGCGSAGGVSVSVTVPLRRCRDTNSVHHSVLMCCFIALHCRNFSRTLWAIEKPSESKEFRTWDSLNMCNFKLMARCTCSSSLRMNF